MAEGGVNTGRLDPLEEIEQPVEVMPDIALPRSGTEVGEDRFQQGHFGWPVLYRDNKTGEYYWNEAEGRTMCVLNFPTRGADAMPVLSAYFVKGTSVAVKEPFTWIYEINFDDGNHVITNLLLGPTADSKPSGFVKLRPVMVRGN